MRPFIRRKKKEFTCGVCGKSGENILPSEYNFKKGVETKPLCMTCANSMRFSALGNYTVKGNEIRERTSIEAIILRKFIEHSKRLDW